MSNSATISNFDIQDSNSAYIELVGANPYFLAIGRPFLSSDNYLFPDPGYNIKNGGSHIKDDNNLKVITNLNSRKVGKYDYNYNYNIDGNVIKTVRIIYVVDISFDDNLYELIECINFPGICGYYAKVINPGFLTI